MNNGTCWDCSYTSKKIGDLKPYLIDRQMIDEIYTDGNANFKIVCLNCWKRQDDDDRFMYDTMKIPIKQLNWDNDKPEKNIPTTPVFNITNNYNLNYTSNIPVTINDNDINNTTNNNSRNHSYYYY